MGSIRNVTILSVLTLLIAAQSSPQNQNSQTARYKLREQLKGLKSISLVVWVSPFDIRMSAEIEHKVEVSAKKILREAGLSLGNEQGAVLSVAVRSFLPGERSLQKYLIVQVKAELLEEAILKRDSKLANPHGFITWDADTVELLPKERLEKVVLKDAIDLIKEFCSDWQLTKDRIGSY